MNKFFFAAVLSLSLSVSAQTIRYVEGTAYNVYKSILFHPFQGTCVGVTTNAIAVETMSLTMEEFHWDGQIIVVRNFPTNDLPAQGVIVRGRAMKVGTTKTKSGTTYELWDYGTVLSGH